MKIKISKRSQALRKSPLKEFFKLVKELEAKGKKIISLGIGDLEIDTPTAIKKAAIKAIRNNHTHYVPESGSAAIKKAIAEKYQCLAGEVVVSSGAKSVIAAILWTILDKNDQIIIPSPYYPPFLEVARSLGAKIILVDTKKDGFILTADNLEKNIKARKLKPKVLIINSPNNPTGAEYPKKELGKIYKLAKKYNFTVISDECYNNYSKDRDFTFRHIDKNAIVINSVSKTYSMTGWRIGWGIMPEELAHQGTLYLENYIGCPSSISERAAIRALREKGVEDFSAQRQIVKSWLSKMNLPDYGLNSGLYAFVDFSKYFDKKKNITNGHSLARYLLQNGVAVTPGEAFGDYENYLRLSYCQSNEKLKKGLLKIEKALNCL